MRGGCNIASDAPSLISSNSIVNAVQSTVPVGVKESNMTEINKKFTAFINKINQHCFKSNK